MEIARINAVHRDRYELKINDEIIYGKLKTSVFYKQNEIVEFPTVGDYVEFIRNDSGDSLITKVLERKSVFKRQNVEQGQPDQTVAANFDYVFIVMSLNRDFHITKLERYLTVAWQSGGTPVIVLSKADLCDDVDYYINQIWEAAPGVDVYPISSKSGQGIPELEKYFAEGKTVVLLGSSGVGKSSLTNAILGKEEMLTGGIREADSQGRHTTTYKQCFEIPKVITLPNGQSIKGGGIIIDTPGMRKLLIGDLEEETSPAFSDIEDLICRCRFSDCSHKSEPGCAIKAALEDGTLDERHWKTYLHLEREKNYSKERKDLMMKRIAKMKRQL